MTRATNDLGRWRFFGGGWLLLAWLVLPGCATTSGGGTVGVPGTAPEPQGGTVGFSEAAPEPEVVFAVTYENFASGYQHLGKFITPDGRVSTFRYAPNDPPWLTHTDSRYTAAELRERFGHSPQPVFVNGLPLVIPGEQLAGMRAQVAAAARGELTGPLRGMFDAGLHRYVAYRYDPIARLFEEVLLYQEGDLSLINASPAARELTLHLMNIEPLRFEQQAVSPLE